MCFFPKFTGKEIRDLQINKDARTLSCSGHGDYSKEIPVIFYWDWETHEDISRVKLGKSRVARKPPILFPICSFIPDCIVLIGAVSAVPYKNGTGIGRPGGAKLLRVTE